MFFNLKGNKVNLKILRNHLGWFISPVEKINNEHYYLWKDLELHRASIGYDSGKHKQRGSAPGYYYSKELAENTLRLFKEKNMNFKVGDEINVTDDSWNFGINRGKYSICIPVMTPMTIIRTGLQVMANAPNGCSNGDYYEINDLMVTDREGSFFFTQSRFCKPVNKKIEVRYFCDGEDITDSISSETKRNLNAT